LEQSKLRLEESNLKLEVANDKLKELDKLKTEFLSLATHQIRSPLTAIKGYASMVVEGSFGKINDKAKEAVDRIWQSSNSLTLVIEDFLNVSKIEAGGMKYEKVNFDLGEVAGSMAKDLSITAEKKGLKLNYTQDSGNHTVNGDKEKLRQVILNLIDNSIKYTKDGSIDVSVVQNGDKITFAVKDTGMGMTPEIKATLFQKFARGEGAKMNTTGSGLGLYLAKEIVSAHNGRIWVDSDGPNKGSTFSMELSMIK
jgi:signal transduction histidine kinase